MREERLDVEAHLAIVCAGLVEKAAPLSRLMLRGQCEHVFDPLPSLRGHVNRPLSSSRCSHALAMRHSRLTVRGEISRTLAVSSTVRPPKNRNSTMRLCL